MSEHAATLNPAATDHLPFFITAPGQTDILFNAMIIFLIAFVFAVGVAYLRLHALPEHLAHGASKMQLQIVGVLALLVARRASPTQPRPRLGPPRSCAASKLGSPGRSRSPPESRDSRLPPSLRGRAAPWPSS